MTGFMGGYFCLFIGVVVGVWLGWGMAHETVADECERLGGFYVGKLVFKCVEVKHGD